MRKRTLIEIGGIKFKNQSNARRFLNLFLAERGPSRITSADSGFDFLAKLLSKHPEHHAIKPEAFRIQYSHFNNLELVYETKGSANVFSYNTCIRGFSGGRDFDKALRTAIMPQVMGVRAGTECVLCGGKFEDGQKTHVDHEVPFIDLKDKFLGLWAEKIPTAFDHDTTRGGLVSFKLEDSEFRTAWVKFHLQNAKLRVVHEMCNLRRPRSTQMREMGNDAVRGDG